MKSDKRIMTRTILLSGLLLLMTSSILLAKKESPHGPALTLECSVCHTIESWEVERGGLQFNHNAQTGYELEGGHITAECIDCHSSLVFSDSPTYCFQCHTDIHENQFGTTCERCHTPIRWVDETEFRQMHASTRFPLTDFHINIDCQECHQDQQYTITPVECFGCHRDDYESSVDPDHHAADFSVDCLMCHTPNYPGWDRAEYTHTDLFPLEYGHNIPGCQVCHDIGYAGITYECQTCHLDDYTSATNPDHTDLPLQCEVCHTTIGWEGAVLDHDLTGFPLEGAHSDTDCEECHTGGQYINTPNTCIGCHDGDYNDVTDPVHELDLYNHDCLVCHTIDAWLPAEIDDHNRTDYPLTGEHLNLDCAECHEEGFNNTPTECYPCHTVAYQEVEDPDHETGTYDQDCTVCHLEDASGWEPATYDHSRDGYTLEGAHIELDCTDCHETGFNATVNECLSCHDEHYNAVVDPNHVDGSYESDCLICHNMDGWIPSGIDDHNRTGYELTGQHSTADCNLCHSEGYNGTPTECYPCHTADYTDTEDPDHVNGNYEEDCTVCHPGDASAWTPAEYDHSRNGYEFEGAHIGLDCTDCHETGFNNTPTTCIGCHEDDYNDVEDPNHQEGHYPDDCTICHTLNEWEPATFNHDDTDFPLTGAHQSTDCLQCHENGYENTPTSCFACHEADYNDSNNPSHDDAGFNTECTDCHNTTAWVPSSWDHDDTGYVLTGSHANTDCNLCHVSQQYENTPTDCFFCHEDDYNEATDPVHASAGFPQDCEQCHNTTAWEPSTFNHQQYFPIYQGSHRNEWDSCVDCHENPNDFTDFTCISCHEHNQADMDDEHDDVPGYIYSSPACYDCHPDGESDDRMFMPQKNRPDENINRD